MKKLLYILAVSILIIIVTTIVAAVVLAYNGGKLDKESKQFVDAAVPAIVTSWDRQQLLDRATPELRRSVTPDSLASMFQGLARLGSLVNYEGAKGEANLSYFMGTGARISASYVAKARFENGSAIFRIALVRRDDYWMINGFHVDPLRLTGQGA